MADVAVRHGCLLSVRLGFVWTGGVHELCILLREECERIMSCPLFISIYLVLVVPQSPVLALKEPVIGHGFGGNVSQLKWRDSLKASRWSKRLRSVLVTRYHSQSTSDGSEDPLTLTPRIIGSSLHRISTTSLIEVTYELLVSYEVLRCHGVHSRT